MEAFPLITFWLQVRFLPGLPFSCTPPAGARSLHMPVPPGTGRSRRQRYVLQYSLSVQNSYPGGHTHV